MKFVRGSLFVVLSIAALALAAVLWGQYQELIGLRARLSAFPSLSEGSNRLAQSKARVEKLQRRRLAGETKTAGQSPKNTVPTGQGKGGWTDSPEAKPLLAAFQNYRTGLETDRLYGALFKQLNLSPEQLAQFRNLIGEKKQAVFDAAKATREQGLAPGSPLFKQAISQAAGSVDDEIQQAIGPAAFSQFQAYEGTLPERNAANLVAQNLSSTPTPLTSDQTEQLVQLLAASRPSSNANQVFRAFTNGYPTYINYSDIEAATTLLSPAQLSGLQQLQEQEQAQQKLWRMLRPPPSPPPAASGKG